MLVKIVLSIFCSRWCWIADIVLLILTKRNRISNKRNCL